MNYSLKSVLVKSSIAIACLGASSTYAQEIDEIVVTAKGNQTLDESLFTTHLFTKADIQAAQVEDVPELLDRVAGISVTDSGGRGSNTSVFIRGAANDAIIVLVDGIRVGSATSGSASLNSYPIEAIERIEVIKGPFSSIYGSDAAAGVIQIFTKKGGDNNKSFTTSFGSNDLQEYSGSFNAGNEKHSLHVSLSHENLNGFDRVITPTTSFQTPENDNDSFTENVIAINGKTTVNDNITASLSVLYSDTNLELDTGTDQTESDDENLNIVLNVENQINDRLVWRNILGFNKNESIGNESELNTTDEDSVFSTERETLSSEINYIFNAKNNITLGADYYREDISDSVTLNFFTSLPELFPDNARDNKGYYAQLVTGYEAFKLVASVRRDENSDYGNDTNYSIALGYELNDNIRFSVSNGTSFNAPTFNDLFFPGFGNPALLPEESESYEFNIVGDYNNFNWSVSLYQTDFDNLISFATFPTSNIGLARIEGYEISVNAKILNWDLGIDIDVLSSEDLATGERLPNRVEETLNLSASRDFGDIDFSFNLKFEHDRFENSNLQLNRLPSYAVFDIRANYSITDNFTVSAKVDNLFDKDFVIDNNFDGSPFNTGGRLAKVSLKYAF